MKHIEVRHHFLRQKVKGYEINLDCVLRDVGRAGVSGGGSVSMSSHLAVKLVKAVYRTKQGGASLNTDFDLQRFVSTVSTPVPCQLRTHDA
jgi:hypothetical protein